MYQPDAESSSRIAQHTNRRRVLLALGSTAVGGGLLARRGTDPAAAVDLETFTVEDATFEADAVSPELEASLAYEYEVPDADGLSVWLAVDGDRIDESSLMLANGSGSDTVSLSAPVTTADGFDAAVFDPDAGETATVAVPVTVGIEITQGGEVRADATDDGTAEIVVQHPEAEPATVTLGGSVTVSDGEQ